MTFLLKNRTVRVPDQLDDIIRFDPNDEVSPEDAGMTREGVDAIWSSFLDYYRTGVHPTMSFCLRRHGKVVFKRAIGHARGNGPDDGPEMEKIPATPDTPICLFSATKAVTAMMVHLLVERGHINLTDPVDHYIPEFGQRGKKNITIHNVLSHQGGFPVIKGSPDPSILFDAKEAVRILCEAERLDRPGRNIAYHAVTGGFILGELIRRVTGKDLREFLDENVRKPLGFKYFNYGVPKKDRDKVALNYFTGFPVLFPFTFLGERALGGKWEDVIDLTNDPRFMEAIIPAANLVATADEMSRFFQLLLNGGELDGVRVFDPLTVRRAIMETGITFFDRTVAIPMRYSTGMMLGSNPMSLMFGPDTKKAFGHWGFINSFCWADRARDTSVAFLNTGKPLVGPHLVNHFGFMAKISKYCTKIQDNEE